MDEEMKSSYIHEESDLEEDMRDENDGLQQ